MQFYSWAWKAVVLPFENLRELLTTHSYGHTDQVVIQSHALKLFLFWFFLVLQKMCCECATCLLSSMGLTWAPPE